MTGPPKTLSDPGEGTAPLRLNRWWPLLVLLAIVPLLYPTVPPLTDLPAHMSRFMVQMDGGRTPELAQWYSFQWNLLPNLGTDLLIYALEPALGLVPGVKTIVILIVALQTAGYLLLSRAAHGRVTATTLFALPLAYGAPLQYGFLNFLLTTALATLSLALWISQPMRARPALRYGLFTVIACVLWVGHLAGWAVFCVMVGSCELAARYVQGRPFWKALSGGFLASSCLLIPQVLGMLWPNTPEHLPTHGFFRLGEKVYFLTNVLMDRWSPFDVVSAFVLAIMIAMTWRSKTGTVHQGLALGAIVLFGLFWLLPGWVYGSYFADMRLTPTMFALALIAARPELPRKQVRWLVLAGLAFFGLRLAGTTVSMAIWDKQFKREIAVLDALPHGSQLVSFRALPCRPFIFQSRLRDMHTASFALLRRHAFANDQFSMSGGQLLTIHNPAAAPFDRDPSSIEIGETCQGSVPVLDSTARIPAAIPYLWIVWHTPELDVPGWKAVARSGASVLYRRKR